MHSARRLSSRICSRRASLSTGGAARLTKNASMRLNQSASMALSKMNNAVVTRSAVRLYSSALPSHIKLTMPALSPTMTEGNLAKWRKKEGDKVEASDVLAEVETDKATVDFESTEEGYLAKILVPEGTSNVQVNTLVAILVDNEADIAAFKDFTDSGASTAPAPAKPAPAPAAGAAPTPAAAPAAAPVAPAAAPAPATGGKVFASPLAKRLAAQKGLDISVIPGSGYGGRIVAADVAEYKGSPAAAAVSAADDDEDSLGLYENIPNSNMRKVIGKRLLESKTTIPHYYLTVELTMDNLLKLRSQLNAKLADSEVKISVNDFIVKAAAAALKKVPAVNSSWTDAAIRQYNYVDISVAVSTDAGLITPIVFDADKKGLADISQNVKELASKARSNKLKPQEYQGGTFTISNLGMFGVNQFAAIINPPQSAILAVGTTSKKVVPDDSNKEVPFKTVNVMNVTLSADHRVIDGAVGAQWLSEFKKFVEDPVTLIL